MISGRADKRIPKGLEEGRIYVGKRQSPVAIIKRKEIKDYMTEKFYGYYNLWTMINAGFGLPYGPKWAEYPEHVLYTLRNFQSLWKQATG